MCCCPDAERHLLGDVNARRAVWHHAPVDERLDLVVRHRLLAALRRRSRGVASGWPATSSTHCSAP
jgi:hypothetical protein